MPELDLLRTLGDQLAPPPLDSLLLAPNDPDAAPAPVEPPQVTDSSRPLRYADGTTIHHGDRTAATDGDAVELDVTDYGVTYPTDDGRIWFTAGSQAEQVGELGEPEWSDRELQDGEFFHNVGDRMVSGNLGRNAAWFEVVITDLPTSIVVPEFGAVGRI